jgi:hypothetical protein
MIPRLNKSERIFSRIREERIGYWVMASVKERTWSEEWEVDFMEYWA